MVAQCVADESTALAREVGDLHEPSHVVLGKGPVGSTLADRLAAARPRRPRAVPLGRDLAATGASTSPSTRQDADALTAAAARRGRPLQLRQPGLPPLGAPSGRRWRGAADAAERTGAGLVVHEQPVRLRRGRRADDGADAAAPDGHARAACRVGDVGAGLRRHQAAGRVQRRRRRGPRTSSARGSPTAATSASVRSCAAAARAGGAYARRPRRGRTAGPPSPDVAVTPRRLWRGRAGLGPGLARAHRRAGDPAAWPSRA